MSGHAPGRLLSRLRTLAELASSVPYLRTNDHLVGVLTDAADEVERLREERSTLYRALAGMAEQVWALLDDRTGADVKTREFERLAEQVCALLLLDDRDLTAKR